MKSAIVLNLFLFSYENIASQQTKAEVIDQLISGLYQKHFFNGAIVAGEKGKIIYSKGFGYSNFKDSVAFTPNTASDGGSNAKTFTAASILLLADQHKLNLGDPVQRYLPNYPYSKTTVRNLITHSVGGLPDYDYFFERAPANVIVSTALNLDLINKYQPPLAYAPNSNFYYDNVGFDLAALVIERVSGMSYNEFLKKNFFQLLHMDSSFVRPALFATWKQGRTVGYRYTNDSLEEFDIADREGFYGGCNIWFTATDLYRWGESFYNLPILSSSLIEKISSAVNIKGKPSYVRQGAWYAGKEKNSFYYWGNVAGFYSWVYWDKDKQFTISFMTNTTMPQWVRPLLTSALINIMTGRKYQPVTEPRADALDRSNLEQVSGTYKIDKLGSIRIMVQGSKVILIRNDGMEYRMHLVDQKTFYIPGWDPWISFDSLKDGHFQKINWNSTTLQTAGKRIPD